MHHQQQLSQQQFKKGQKNLKESHGLDGENGRGKRYNYNLKKLKKLITEQQKKETCLYKEWTL